jgi:N-dimethylarginine dimethylaminohydrolase
MCPPVYFDVSYAINPWMDPATAVNRGRALDQWSTLVEAYRSHGHRVDLLDPVDGLPDLVFAANGATVIDGQVLQARFANPQRSAEAGIHADWHRRHGLSYGGRGVQLPSAVNEAEGDFAVTSDRILAGYGFRTRVEAHREIGALTSREVVSLELVNPLFYHLDVALTVLDDVADQLAYYPPAFSIASQQLLADLYPNAIIATDDDAYALGLNCVSDGYHVFIPAHAEELRENLRAAGFDPIEIDLSELRRGGGSVKCCTQEIRQAVGAGKTRASQPTSGGPA